MDLQNRQAIRQRAAERLAAASGAARNTALAYGVITAAASFAVTFILFLLDRKIANTGGLGNMTLRSVLETARYILPILLNVALLCLSFGYRIAALRLSRRESCAPATLPEGFRSFGPLVRLAILEVLIYGGIAFVMIYLASQIFLMTPFAQGFISLMLPLISNTSVMDTGIILDDATLLAATRALIPMIPIFLALFLLAAVPIFYQYRMARFVLADEPRKGALAALGASRNMMRRNRRNLFKLDLGFWWYYLAQIVIGLLGYGDVFLSMLGVSLPFSATVSSFLFYGLSLAAQVALYALCLNRVSVTYAAAYDAIRPRPQQTNKVVLGNIFQM